MKSFWGSGLYCSTSMGPSVSVTCSSARASDLGSRTSAAKPRACTPARPSSSASTSSRAWLRETRPTAKPSAPNRRATAAPRPAPAPMIAMEVMPGPSDGAGALFRRVAGVTPPGGACPRSWPGPCSGPVDVLVELVALELQLVDAVLDDVADADDPDQPAARTTGTWRTRRSVITFISSSTWVSSSQVSTTAVMIAATVLLMTVPSWWRCRTTSRSLTMPSTDVPSELTISAPTLCSASCAISSRTPASGPIVTTSRLGLALSTSPIRITAPPKLDPWPSVVSIVTSDATT